MPHDDLEVLVCLHAYSARFLTKPASRCRSGYACLHARINKRHSRLLLSERCVKDMTETLLCLEADKVAPLLAKFVFQHPGPDSCDADASGSPSKPGLGFGAHVRLRRLARGHKARFISPRSVDLTIRIARRHACLMAGNAGLATTPHERGVVRHLLRQ